VSQSISKVLNASSDVSQRVAQITCCAFGVAVAKGTHRALNFITCSVEAVFSRMQFVYGAVLVPLIVVVIDIEV
jgi:hypothetical protein